MADVALSIAVAVAAFAVLLAFIVFIHEYGHFKMARLCGVKVDVFSIGFGPAFLKWTDRKGTVWKIASIPLGGFVKFFGDANAASAGADAQDEAHGPATTQFGSEKDRLDALLSEEEKRVCFHFKPVWQRMLIVASGPLSNFILAIVIFAGLFMAVGVRTLDPVVGRVASDTAAADAGFEPGDRVLAINGRRIDDFNELAARVKLGSDETLRFAVERDGEREVLVATPRRTDQTDGFGNDVRQGQLGIELYSAPVVGFVQDGSPAGRAGIEPGDRMVRVADEEIFTFSDIARAIEGRMGETVPVVALRAGAERRFSVTLGEAVYTAEDGTETRYATFGVTPQQAPLRRLGPIQAAGAGVERMGEVLGWTIRYLGRLVSFQEDPRQLGGPVKIAQYAGQAAQSGFDPNYDISLGERLILSLTQFIQLAALISISIGFMNLLPIPVLDGGHLVYYAYEAVAGRPLSDRVQGIGFRIGLAVVGTFMIFVLVNDVVGLF